MPDRYIKESITTSDTIDALSWFEEVFFYRLTVCCDDFGRFDARPAVMKSRMFPLKTITDATVNNALHKLQTVGLVTTYTCDGKPYLQLVTWAKHQRTRAKNSKYPNPIDGELQQMADTRGHLTSNDSQVTSNVADSDSEKRIANNEKRIANDEKRESAASAITPKTTYGEFGKVKLSPDEHAKLQERLGDVGTQAYILRLDGWLAEGNSKKNHYATLLNWWRGDGEPVQRSTVQSAAKPDTGREITADMTTEELF